MKGSTLMLILFSFVISAWAHENDIIRQIKDGGEVRPLFSEPFKVQVIP